jgi:hypothetical protein
MEEIWKDIPDYEGLYQVSNLGRVKSLTREWVNQIGVKCRRNGTIKKLYVENRGYVIVNLWRNSKGKTYFVHQLVAMAFLGHIPNGLKLVVDHINDNPSDNKVENLQIVTQRFNSCKTQGKYSSKYKGVYWGKNINKWRAQIEIKGIKKQLGSFDCELKAHQAYQNALNNLIIQETN